MELGTVSQAQAKRVKMQACKYKPSGNVQQIQEFSLSLLVLYSLKSLPSSSLSLLNGLYQVYHAMYHSFSSLEYGDSYLFSCTYILGHALGMQAFTFLLCVLALCMMYVYIYLLAPSSVIVTIHVTQGQVMPNFRSKSKVTCRRIFAVKIWHFVRKPQESIDWDHTHLKDKP